MMNWYGSGMNGGAWLLMGLFWLALIGLIVWLVVRLLPESATDTPGREARETPLEILDRRLARGEIDIDTYQGQRAALASAKVAGK